MLSDDVRGTVAVRGRDLSTVGGLSGRAYYQARIGATERGESEHGAEQGGYAVNNGSHLRCVPT